jgi:hypothetical protein
MDTPIKPKKKKLKIGWKECCALPELGITKIHAKVDTGATTSALHVEELEEFIRDGKAWVKFYVYPHQYDDEERKLCEAEVTDQRWVRNSGGQREFRYVITTKLKLGKRSWKIALTLTNRDLLNFRMLLGRECLAKRCLIDTGKRYRQGHR